MAEITRATYGAAIRLAAAVSVVAALLAMTLSAVGEVSTSRMIAFVVIVGFSASWVQTGRVQRTMLARRPVTVLPTR